MSNPGADELNESLANLAEIWRVSNKYHAAATCENCQGIVRHEKYCITINANVLYAFESILDPALMVEADHILLHGMGVRWNLECKGVCA